MVLEVDQEGSDTPVKIMDDYRYGRRYWILDGGETCITTDMFESAFHSCVPETSTLVSSTKFGPPGSVIDVDLWKDDGHGIEYEAAVTRDKCYPVSMAFRGIFNGISIDVDRSFYGVTEGLSDRSKLRIPRSCRRTARSCCLPDQYSVTFSDIGVSYDATKKSQTRYRDDGMAYVDNINKMFTLYNSGNDPTVPAQIIEDYKANISYTINRDGSCTADNIRFPSFPHCVTDHGRSRYLRTRYLGGPYAQLKVHTWETGFSRMDLTDDCLPVSESFTVTTSDGTNEITTHFVNLQMGLTNMSIFDIPPQCPRSRQINYIDGIPARCCKPDKWHGTLIGAGAGHRTSGEFSSYQFQGEWYYDATQSWGLYVRGNQSTHDGVRVIVDYKLGTRYVMRDNGYNCTVHQVFRPIRNCIHEKAIYVGAQMFGPPGDQYIVDTWNSTVYGMTFLDSVTRDNCYPVTNERNGVFNRGKEETYEANVLITNFTLGIPADVLFGWYPSKLCFRPPPACCFPTQFTSALTELGNNYNMVRRKQSLVDIAGMFYFDSINQKLTTDLHNRTGNTTRTIQDFAQQKSYTLKDGACTVAPFNQTMITCVPDGADWHGSRYFGRPENQNRFNQWRFDIGDTHVRLLVQEDNCYPLMEAIRGVSGNVTYEYELYFLNITPGINDTSVFTIPTSCTPATAG